MFEFLKSLPNQLTAARLLMIPFLWAFAFANEAVWVGAGLALAFVTDVLDGYIARKNNLVTDFGSQFDSLADNIFQPCAIAWLWMLEPQIFRDNALACWVAVIVYALSLTIGWLKFRRVGNLHLYSSKIGAVLQYTFAAHALIAQQYSAWLFYLAVGMFILSSTETLLLQLTRAQVDEHIGSILLPLFQRAAESNE